MAVVFTIPGDPQRYTYPESPRDVPFGKFLDYLEHLEPERPEIMRDLDALSAEAAPHLDELGAYTDAADIEWSGNLADVPEVCAVYLAADRATGKGRKVVPILRDALRPLAARREKLIEKLTQLEYATTFLPYYARVVAHFTGLDYDTIIGRNGQHMSFRQVEAIYSIIIDAINAKDYEPDESGQYVFEGTRYMLPARLMEKATVIEFAESAQFQAHMKDVKNGHWKALLDVCAVLMRPEGTKYEEQGYNERKKDFERLPLATVLDVAFFLMRSSRTLEQNSLISTLAQVLAKQRRASARSREATAGT